MRLLRQWRMTKLTKLLLTLAIAASVGLLLRLLGVLFPSTSTTVRRDPIDDAAGSPSSVCHSPRCIAAFEEWNIQRRQEQNTTTTAPLRVPPIRHILWKNRNVSAYFAGQLKTWRAVHPNWRYILWQDSDLDDFVAKRYPGLLAKFRSLSHHIMRIDMIRYLILHHFGGVYADLDYILVRSLDRFRAFPVVVTRETEAHSLLHFGMSHYPPPLLASPAFLMSEPGHQFFAFCASQLATRPAKKFMEFAGPRGLSDLLLKYAAAFPVSISPYLTVYVPASNSFYPYANNRLNSSRSGYQDGIRTALREGCANRWRSRHPKLTAYCRNILNLDAITDPKEPVYAVHDNMKLRSAYDERGSPAFYDNSVDIGAVLPGIVMASSLY